MNYSVLMCVYYKEKSEYLRKSLESMFNQTIKTDDFVLVLDGPLTHELYDVINEFKDKYGSILNTIQLDENIGLGRALNIGLEKCKNEIVARMDSDDISLPNRCELQLTEFANNPNLDIISGTVCEFSENQDCIISEKRLSINNSDIYKYAKKRCPFNHPCVMYKKSAVLKAGGYQHFLWFEDYYLWIRMLNNGVTASNLKDPLLLMRSGIQMYKRRGGLKYLKQMIKFRKYMYNIGFCNFSTFMFVATGQFLVCILPVKLRKFIYEYCLRK